MASWNVNVNKVKIGEVLDVGTEGEGTEFVLQGVNGCSLTVMSGLGIDGSGSGNGGGIEMGAGNSGTGATGRGGDFEIYAGRSSAVNGEGGDMKITSGKGSGSGDGGSFEFSSGTGGTVGNGGTMEIFCGNGGSSAGGGGSLHINAGNSPTAIGGVISLTPGTSASGNDGLISFNGNTTFSKTTASQVFNNSIPITINATSGVVKTLSALIGPETSKSIMIVNSYCLPTSAILVTQNANITASDKATIVITVESVTTGSFVLKLSNVGSIGWVGILDIAFLLM